MKRVEWRPGVTEKPSTSSQAEQEGRPTCVHPCGTDGNFSKTPALRDGEAVRGAVKDNSPTTAMVKRIAMERIKDEWVEVTTKRAWYEGTQDESGATQAQDCTDVRSGRMDEGEEVSLTSAKGGKNDTKLRRFTSLKGHVWSLKVGLSTQLLSASPSKEWRLMRAE